MMDSVSPKLSKYGSRAGNFLDMFDIVDTISFPALLRQLVVHRHLLESALACPHATIV